MSSIKALHVLRDVLILWVLTASGGFVIGFFNWSSTNSSQVVMYIALSNIILSILGFVIVGYQTVNQRWLHLSLVAFVLWLTSYVNVIFFNFSVTQWLLSMLMVLVTMVVGGGIASLIKKNH